MKSRKKNSVKMISLILVISLIVSLLSCMSGTTVFAADRVEKQSEREETVSVEPLYADASSGGVKPNGDTTHDSHCYCGGEFNGKLDHTCTDGVVWQELADTATNLPSSGNYYLSGNLSISDTGSYQVTGDLHICFNGYTITFTKPRGVIYQIGSTLTKAVNVSFCDCDPDFEGGIQHNVCNSNSSGIIFTMRNTDFENRLEIFGGIFDGRDSYCASGNIFCVDKNSVINIYGGTFKCTVRLPCQTVQRMIAATRLLWQTVQWAVQFVP